MHFFTNILTRRNKMKKLISLTIAASACLLTLEAHAVQPATKALFCESCTNTTTAMQAALANPAPMVCTKPPKLEPEFGFNAIGTSVTCTREEQKVVLLNPNTNQKWAYLVKPTNDYQSIYLEDSYLSGNEEEAYQTAIDTRNAWMAAIDKTNSEPNVVNDLSFLSSSKSNLFLSNQTDSCPEESALDIIKDPVKIARGQTKAADDLERNLNGLLASFGLGNGRCGKVVNETIQVTIGGVTSSVSTHDGEQIVNLVSRDYNNELSGNDELVYSLAGPAQCGTNGNWQVQMNLDLGKSKILGFQNVQSAAHAIYLASDGGETELNDCLRDDLEELGQQANNSTTERWDVVPFDPTLGLNTGWRLQCFIDFYQEGVFQFSYKVPCE